MDLARNASSPGGGLPAGAAVQCEILPVACTGGRVTHLRRGGTTRRSAAPWWVESPPGRNPSQVVAQALARELGSECEPPNSVVHSTSWRYDAPRLSLVLSFLVILRGLRQPPAGFVLEPVEALGPGLQTCGGRAVQVSDVLAHGLKHFALLRLSDPTIAAALPAEWHAALARLHPLPAGLLDHYLPQPSGHLPMTE